MNRLLQALLWTLLGLAPCWAGEALWNPVTTAELLQASNLVVLGRIVSLQRGVPGPDCIDRAVLRIERTLAGAPRSWDLTLVFPGRDRGRLRLDGSLEPEQNPSFIRFDFEQEGIFFLRERSDGTYSANHPARFKPRFLLGQVLRDLSGPVPGG